MNVTLTPTQSRRLRAMAHDLDPVVHTGRKGTTEELVQQVDGALHDHELIKIKIGKNHTGKVSDIASNLASATTAALVHTIGRVAVLYRKHPDEPKIDPGAP